MRQGREERAQEVDRAWGGRAAAMDAAAYGAPACGAAHLSVQEFVDHPRERVDLCVALAEDRGSELNYRARMEDGHVLRQRKIPLVDLCECNAHEISTR